MVKILIQEKDWATSEKDILSRFKEFRDLVKHKMSFIYHEKKVNIKKKIKYLII